MKAAIVFSLLFIGCTAYAQGVEANGKQGKSQPAAIENQGSDTIKLSSTKDDGAISKAERRKIRREKKRANRNIRKDRLENQLTYMYVPLD